MSARHALLDAMAALCRMKSVSVTLKNPFTNSLKAHRFSIT
jgi:hypothetical protein